MTFPDPARPGRLLTHRLRSIRLERGIAHMITKGDANNETETWSVKAGGKIGRVRSRIPKIGYALIHLGRPGGALVLMALPCLLLMLYELRRIWRKPMSVARLVVAVLVLASLAAGGKTFSAFSKTTSNANDRLQSARIFPRDRAVPAQTFSDVSSGTAIPTVNPLAFADATTLTTSPAATTFASNRYIDVELSGTVPDGLPATTASAEIDFADNNTDTKQSCLYFESRRISTDAVLNTWGSPAAPLAATRARPPRR